MIILCVLWFFAVSVYEPVPFSKPPRVPEAEYKNVGGWSHDGPHTTLTECEARRIKQATPNPDLVARYKPGPCFKRTYEEYVLDSKLFGLPR